MSNQLEKLEVNVVNIIGGFATFGLPINIILCIIVFSLPAEWQYVFWLIAISIMHVIFGLIIKLSRHHVWAENIAAPGTLIGASISISLIFIGFMAIFPESFCKAINAFVFCIACSWLMLLLGCRGLKNIRLK